MFKKWLILGLSIILLILTMEFLFGYGSNAKAACTKCGSSSSSRSLDPNGPYFQQIFTATSRDGINWEKQNRMLFNHASVPGAVVKDNVIYLYFADAEANQVSVAKSYDNGQTFNKERVYSERLPVDPHPEIVGNKIRLYFIDNQMTNGRITSSRMAYAESEDGVHFGSQKTVISSLKGTTDPDVFQTDSDVRILASQGRKLVMYISHDGGNSFGSQINTGWSNGAVSDTVRFTNTYRTYTCAGKSINSATGANQGRIRAEAGSRVTINPGTRYICAPSVVQLSNGTYLMFYTILV